MKNAHKNIFFVDFSNIGKRLLVFSFLSLLFSVGTFSQAQTDTLKNQFQKEFNEFKQSTQQEFDRFKNHNDSVFYRFLNDSWTEFQLMQDVKPANPKPKVQPVIKDAVPKQIRIEPQQPKTMLQDTGKQIQFQFAPRTYGAAKPAKSYSTINFYGSKIRVFKAGVPTLDYGKISKTSIADFFEGAAKSDDLTYSVFDLFNKAKHTKLNGWGYLRLLQEASVTHAQTLNEQVLFAWTALLRTGFDARIGFDENNIYLFVNFDVPVFYKLYLSKGGRKYYLVPFKGQKKPTETIHSYRHDFPAELNRLSLVLKENPVFGAKSKTRKIQYFDKSISLSYNANLVDFYKTYPDCDLVLYFPPPLSGEALSSLSIFLEGNSSLAPVNQVNELLSFVQHGLPYEADDKQFGYENYLFAEEALFYPSVDCEDRTVFLSQLVEHFTGFKSIALAYPGHVTLAVNIPETVNGSYLMHKGEKYYVCDPTYIGAKCGMLMPEFENEKPEIIAY